MKPPLSPSYKFEKEEKGGEGLEEEEREAAPPAVIPGSATANNPCMRCIDPAGSRQRRIHRGQVAQS